MLRLFELMSQAVCSGHREPWTNAATASTIRFLELLFFGDERLNAPLQRSAHHPFNNGTPATRTSGWGRLPEMRRSRVRCRPLGIRELALPALRLAPRR